MAKVLKPSAAAKKISIMVDPLVIVSTATIKKCTMKPGCADLQFDGLQFTGDQYKKISTWLKDAEGLEITIKPVQAVMEFDNHPPISEDDLDALEKT